MTESVNDASLQSQRAEAGTLIFICTDLLTLTTDSELPTHTTTIPDFGQAQGLRSIHLAAKGTGSALGPKLG